MFVLASCYSGLPGSTGSADEVGQADDGASESGVEGNACDELAPGSSPIRRLTPFEYDNTIADLLGDTSRPGRDFAKEGGSGFDNNATVASVSRLQAEKYMRAAEGIATRATEDLTGLLGCEATDELAAQTECVAAWVRSFGQRAWRRPLGDDEVEAMLELFAAARDEFDLRESVSLLLQAFLQSPHFLYRVEFGGPAASEGAVELTDYEMASRLSYFLWSSMPDDELFDVAQRGELHSPEQVEEQARRMLDQPRTRAMVLHFHEQWLDYRDIDGVTKDPELFPEYTAEIAAAQRAEIEAFIDHVIWDGEGTLDALLSAPYTFADETLASYYGVPYPGGAGLQQITPTDRETAGVFTQGAIMSVHAKARETHPIARGLFVREQLLCTIPPPPPDDVDLSPPPVDPDATTRERYEQHRSDPVCSGCHALMDPLGFALENFDATGRWRITENDLEIDASGELIGTDVDGAFRGPRELAERLASSTTLRECVATQWFRFAYGRTETPELDACTLDDLDARFAAVDYDIREFLVALTQTDAFLYRPAAEEN